MTWSLFKSSHHRQTIPQTAIIHALSALHVSPGCLPSYLHAHLLGCLLCTCLLLVQESNIRAFLTNGPAVDTLLSAARAAKSLLGERTCMCGGVEVFPGRTSEGCMVLALVHPLHCQVCHFGGLS